MSQADFKVRNGLSVNSTVFVVNAQNSTVGINTASAAVTFDLQANDAIRVAVGNTSQRPTPSNGLLRFNSDTQTLEYAILTTFLSIGASTDELGAI